MAFVLSAFLKGLLIGDPVDPTKELAIEISPSATTNTSTTIVAAQTANRTVTLPDATGTILTTGTPIPVNQLAAMAINKAVITDGSGFLTTSTTTATELSYVHGVTSSIQTQLNMAGINPMTTLGDMIYENAVPTSARLPGNTTATKNFLTQTGTGSISASPAWGTIQVADVPTLNQNTTGTASNITGIAALVHGGTGIAAGSANAAFNALSPMTTGGDLIYGGASGIATRLANGTSGQVLTSAGGTAAPTWSAPVSGWNYTAQSTTYSASINDFVVASGASFLITLPTAVGVAGKKIGIKHEGTSLTQLYTINTTSSQTIDGIGSGSYQLFTNKETLIVVSNGANWEIESHFTSTQWVNDGTVVISAVTTAPVRSGNTELIDNVWWRRNGANAEIRLEFVQTAAGSNTAGSGDYLFRLPANMTADTTLLTVLSGTSVGTNVIFKAHNVVGNGTVTFSNVQIAVSAVMFDSTQFRIGGSATTTTGAAGIGVIGSTEAALTNAAVSYAATLSIPISGWQP